MSFYQLWLDDRQSILATMARNLSDDLFAGYDYNGASCCRQRAEMADYAAETAAKIAHLKTLDEKRRETVCRNWLKKSGAIA